ncbi:hypothetical protein [Streptomyces sp. NPDC096013]
MTHRRILPARRHGPLYMAGHLSSDLTAGTLIGDYELAIGGH